MNKQQAAASPIERYYQFHAKIYDATRWSFLFGRSALIRSIADCHRPARILEVGCGTGKNLVSLCGLFPAAHITGLDMSAEMLDITSRKLGAQASRVTLLHQPYDQPLRPAEPYDLVLCSYSLSMINPGWDAVIDYACSDVAVGGLVAVVDFHDSRFPFFKRWMRMNHVRMDGHLLPKLETCLHPQRSDVRRAYGGLWSYLLFIGQKAGA